MKGKTWKEKEDKYKVMEYDDIKKDAVVENNTGIICLAHLSHCCILWQWHPP